jgi:putative two-component system response regulator
MHEEELPLILIVEDEQSIRQILCSALEDEYRILQAEHGRAALELIDAHPELTMVLTDVMMPLVDGIELICAIRERSLLLPVVVMTAYDKHQHVLAALRTARTTSCPSPSSLI